MSSKLFSIRKTKNNYLKYNYIFYLITLTLACAAVLGSSFESGKNKKISKISLNDDYEYISVNQCLMWTTNNGIGSHNPISDDAGFLWPGGADAEIPAVFSDGLIWAGKIKGEIRAGGSTYRSGLQAGKIMDNGLAGDPDDPKYRIYKVKKDWRKLPDGPARRAYQKDYEEWPVEDGAPWIDADSDGIYTIGIDEPDIIGDEMLWCVFNDLDPVRTNDMYGTAPIGLEIQSSVFGFARTGPLGDMLFKIYKIINKSENIIEDFYVGYFSDADLGYAGDDVVGCDPSLNIGYTYNGDNNDEDNYGNNPPALGYVLLKNENINSGELLGMTSFLPHLRTPPFEIYGAGQDDGYIGIYNNLSGFSWEGFPVINPLTGDTTKFALDGDPVSGEGWYEGPGWPGGPDPTDIRILLSSGPLDLNPGDTQEVIIGTIIARGSDNIQSVAELKKNSAKAIALFENNFQEMPELPVPDLKYYTEDNKISFYWNTELENNEIMDQAVTGTHLNDVKYEFEGYILRQYSDIDGSDEKIIATSDLRNNINELTEISKTDYPSSDIFYELDNQGIIRSHITERDSINLTSLKNNQPYYFSLSAFAVSENNDPMFIESRTEILEIFPGSVPANVDINDIMIGTSYLPQLLEGQTSAEIKFVVKDPTQLTGDTYQLSFRGVDEDIRENRDQLSYTLINKSKNITLLENRTDFMRLGPDESYLEYNNDQLTVDGFQVNIRDIGFEAILKDGISYAVLDVLEVKGPGGKEIDEPVSVDEKKPNSTGEWSVFAGLPNNRYNWQGRRNQEGLGTDFYEIRFIESGSDYFASGYNTGTLKTVHIKDDAKGIGKVPFEIWNIKQTPDDPDDDERLIVKILDNVSASADSAVNDLMWTQLPSGNWEMIYAFSDSTMDPDNLPEMSGVSEYTDHKFGSFVISGSKPEEGTVIRIFPAIWLNENNVFEITMPKADLESKEHAKEMMNKINVFPNPYYGTHGLELSRAGRFVRFINLPRKAVVRVFNLGGAFIQKIFKEDNSDFIDWDLRNRHGQLIASGLYLAYIDLPGIGTKVLKLAVIREY